LEKPERNGALADWLIDGNEPRSFQINATISIPYATNLFRMFEVRFFSDFAFPAVWRDLSGGVRKISFVSILKEIKNNFFKSGFPSPITFRESFGFCRFNIGFYAVVIWKLRLPVVVRILDSAVAVTISILPPL
jgi:hypothetical protein